MIAVKQPTASSEAPPKPQPSEPAPPPRPRWSKQVSAIVLVLALVASIGGAGVRGSATTLQSRALALHEHWAYMRDNGIPSEDLAPLEREWKQSQESKFFGTPSMLWVPVGAETVNRWQQASDTIWSRDLARFKSDATLAEQGLHRAVGAESFQERKLRLDALRGATTPLDFATLRDGWNLQARLLPIDASIAGSVAGLLAETQRATGLGIRSDPASSLLARAGAYSGLSEAERLARARILGRDLLSVQTGLQARIAAARVATQNFERASSGISVAGLYGINLSGFQQRVATARAAYAGALTVATFTAVTQDLQQIYKDADRAVRVVLSQTRVIAGVAMIHQNHPLSCEEAATSMALTHQGIHLSQDQILREIGADLRPMHVDAAGVRWGNPYRTFVGNVNGSESNYTGFGTFYPPLVRVARAHGATILAYGTMSAATIYARVLAGHPVVAFATWDWRWHPRRDYVSFDGQRIPWIGPVYASHVYTVVGVGPGRVLVNDPIRGQYWISKAAFEAGYSDFREAIVFA